MSNDALIERINAAYRRLSAATKDLVRADRELAESTSGGSAWTMQRLSWRPGREDSEPLPRRPARHRGASTPGGQPNEGGARPPARKP